MRKAEILTTLGFIGFAIAVMVQAWQVGFGWVGGQPQAGFFPFWLGLLLAGCGAVVLVPALVASKASAGAFFHDRTALTSVIKVSLTGAVMLVLTYLIGFYAAAIAYLFVYTRFVGKHSWLAVIVMSLLIPYGSYILFERTLKILLPRGMFSVLPFLD